jgi:acetyl-CoA carboxylase carboxyl transferase subunit alpha
LKITAHDCHALGVADEVVPEPPGGAHRRQADAVRLLGEAVERHLVSLDGMSAAALRADRYERFRRLGAFEDRS